jgi:hypothetical protein
MNTFFRLNICLFLLICLSCQSKSNDQSAAHDATKLEAKPLIIDKSEDSFGGDIKFSIVSIEKNGAYNTYKVNSTHEGKNVGFDVIMPNIKEDKKGFGNGIIIKKSNDISHNFINLLQDVYKIKSKKELLFVDSIKANYVDLGAFMTTISGQKAEQSDTKQYKLFFEGDEDYAEIYLNINEQEHWIELREKDEEYRPLILAFLSKK